MTEPVDTKRLLALHAQANGPNALDHQMIEYECAIRSAMPALALEVERLRSLVHNPHTDSFLEAVRLEAAHQTECWSVEHDAGKEPQDWFWLLGWLAGKALKAALSGDTQKALHHCVSSAALLLNWHAHLSGVRTAMRPGIAPPEVKEDR